MQNLIETTRLIMEGKKVTPEGKKLKKLMDGVIKTYKEVMSGLKPKIGKILDNTLVDSDTNPDIRINFPKTNSGTFRDPKFRVFFKKNNINIRTREDGKWSGENKPNAYNVLIVDGMGAAIGVKLTLSYDE